SAGRTRRGSPTRAAPRASSSSVRFPKIPSGRARAGSSSTRRPCACCARGRPALWRHPRAPNRSRPSVWRPPSAARGRARRLRRRLDPEAFDAALALLTQTRERGGRVHVTGIGKPEHLARYAASLFASTGTPAYFLHATEVVHGSAGQIHAGDVVIAISNSGGTPELLGAVAAGRGMVAHVTAVTRDA